MNNIPIYWINLDRSPERKVLMENQFKEYNITNHQRIQGIDGKNVDFTEYKDKCADITVYELACTLSHLKAIQTSYNNNDEYALIFEDDCSFEYLKYQKYSIQELVNIMNNDHKDWNILQLCTSGRIDQNKRMRDNPKLIEKKNKNCTTAYLITRKGMKNLLDCSSKYTPADHYLYSYTRNTFFLTKPYFIYHFSNIIKSDVHNQGKNSNQTAYKREDESKQFWDSYWFSKIINTSKHNSIE